MSSKLDEFVQEIQDLVTEESKAAYGDAAFERWHNPTNLGHMSDPDGYGRLAGSCGDTMEIFLKFDGATIKEALFQTTGCGATLVCGSLATEMVLGKTPDEVMEITGETILEKLGGLPSEDEHCAMLAGETLQEALHDYMVKSTK